MTATGHPLSLDEYLLRTRGRGFNIVVVTAALVVYELGLVLTGSPERNAADAYLKQILTHLHRSAGPAFLGLVLVLFFLAVRLYARRSRSILRYLWLFLVECLCWASLLAPAIVFIGDPRLGRAEASRMILDVGAGVYEEIVFRLLLLRGLAFVMGLDFFHAFADESGDRSFVGLQASGRLFVAVVASAAAFSLYHHVGPGGDPWLWSLLVFRFLAGILFAGLYFLRGLGVCVYAHAFYDILVHLVHEG